MTDKQTFGEMLTGKREQTPRERIEAALAKLRTRATRADRGIDAYDLTEIASALADTDKTLQAMTLERDTLRADAERLDWMDMHLQRESSMRFSDMSFKTVKAWAISAEKTMTLREAIDGARAALAPTGDAP